MLALSFRTNEKRALVDSNWLAVRSSRILKISQLTRITFELLHHTHLIRAFFSCTCLHLRRVRRFCISSFLLLIMSESTPLTASPTQLQAPSSLWDRVSTWVSDNRVAAYTIAGTVVVVTSAGAIYYFSDSKKPAPAEKKKSKKERRKEKKEAEEAARKIPDVEASTSSCSILFA
jgi:hypothetical protein